MAQKKVESGEYIYREGDSADNAYTVVSGQIELLENHDGREVQTVVITSGQVFGELAVFSPASTRSHSARAMEAVMLESMTPDEMQTYIDQCPKQILPFLKRAFERMKSTRVKKNPTLSSAIQVTDVSTITIAPSGEKLKGAFAPIEVPIARLPFRIGGYPEGGEASRRDQLHLSLAVQDNPLRVSRQHCEITTEGQSVIIMDLGSRFCTHVNNFAIGAGRGGFSAPLKKGANDVVLGAADGPYKLTVTCK